MLRALYVLILALFVSSAVMAAPVIGEAAPDFTGTDVISGKTLTLSDLKGKTVVLEWNNFNCPFVKKFYSVGAMQELQTRTVKDGVVWVSINSSAKDKEGYLPDAKAAKALLAEHKSHATYYLLDHDGKIGHAYEAKSTPHMFVIDQDGKLAYMGAIDNKPTADSADIASATNYVTEALKSLKAGKPVKVKQTRPYGCFVKYE